MSSKGWHRVLRSDELPRPRGSSGDDDESLAGRATASMVVPEIKTVGVRGRGLCVTRLPSGEVVAFGANCPHQGTPLRHAALYEGNILCPQHSYVYEPHTGRNLYPSRDARPEALERMKPGALDTYPVVERDGWVWVNEEPNPLEPPEAGAPGASAPASGASAPASGASAGVSAGAATSPGAGTPGAAAGRAPASQAAESETGLVDDQPRELSVPAGERFQLVLPTQPQPNHLWWVQLDGDAVEVEGQRFEHRDGAPTYLVDLLARQPGEAQVHCSYAKPWQAHARDRRTFTVDVVESG